MKQNVRKLKKIIIDKSINKKDEVRNAIEEMWAQTLSFEDDEKYEFLKPVTIEEKMECINNFKSYMNPNSTFFTLIYNDMFL
jgi:hypothetical protein